MRPGKQEEVLTHMNFTRRDFGKLALAAIPATTLLAAKPNSKWGGVQVGVNAPYSFNKMSGTADKILEYMTRLNLSATELRLQPVEAYLGAPGVYASGNDSPKPAPVLTPEQKTAAAADLTKWRSALSLDKLKAFRQKYEDAGVLIQILKVDNIGAFTDDMIDYAFTAAKALGANAISTEGKFSETKRLGAFAAKHKLMIGYHGHTDVTSNEAFGSPESWERAMEFSPYNGINLDIGHFVAGNSKSPIEFMKKHHDKITHIHIKDKKMHEGPNTPFGQGDTPIVEVLQLMKKEKWTFQGTIEYEYATPADSDVLTEIGKCVEYCRKALES